MFITPSPNAKEGIILKILAISMPIAAALDDIILKTKVMIGNMPPHMSVIKK